MQGYDLFDLRMEDEDAQHYIELTKQTIEHTREENARKYEVKRDKLTRGDELPPGCAQDGEGVHRRTPSSAAW